MSLFADAPTYIYSEEADEILGMPGRMLSGSKQGPETVYWNACVFNEAGEQIWHGDLDTAKETEKLQALAARLGLIYVTPEQPYRFEGLEKGRKNSHDPTRVLRFTAEQSGANNQ